MTRPDVSIVSSGHDVADARVHRIAETLAPAGLTVELLGLGDPAGAPSSVASVTARPRGSVRTRPLVAARYARQARGHVLITMDPDMLLAALPVARARRQAVVADVSEDYSAVLKDRSWATGIMGRAGALVARAGDALARSADLVVVADEHVPPRSARHRLVLRNMPFLGMLPKAGVPDSPLRALYIGDVRASRGLFTMLDGAEEAGWQVDIVGNVAAADYESAARHPAVQSGLVRLHGRRPPRSAWELARGAAVGLSLLADTPAFRDAIPSKVYEYAACGLPMIVTDLPRPAEFVRTHGAGIVLPPGAGGAELASALGSLAADPGLRDSLAAGAAGFRSQMGEWEAEYAAVRTAVVDLVAQRRARVAR